MIRLFFFSIFLCFKYSVLDNEKTFILKSLIFFVTPLPLMLGHFYFEPCYVLPGAVLTIPPDHELYYGKGYGVVRNINTKIRMHVHGIQGKYFSSVNTGKDNFPFLAPNQKVGRLLSVLELVERSDVPFSDYPLKDVVTMVYYDTPESPLYNKAGGARPIS